jgi:hypothetical protein
MAKVLIITVTTKKTLKKKMVWLLDAGCLLARSFELISHKLVSFCDPLFSCRLNFHLKNFKATTAASVVCPCGKLINKQPK